MIHPDADAAGTVTLTGTQCSSAKALRFCYGACDLKSPVRRPVETLVLETSTHLDYTGYMVFPGPGLMRLQVTDSHGIVSTVVIEVPAMSSS